MRAARLFALAASFVGLLASSPVFSAPPGEKPEPKWALSWQAALEEAKERNVPIYLAYHQDG